VALGDLVRVSGTVGEFQGQTQVGATTVTVCGTGTITPVDVTLPVPSADYLERFAVFSQLYAALKQVHHQLQD
jgi:predicted extracellular nuclease